VQAAFEARQQELTVISSLRSMNIPVSDAEAAQFAWELKR
jgi:hypothetical protein